MRATTSPVPTVVATDVLVKADDDSPITVTADNTYPTVPECPLTVSAKGANAKGQAIGRRPSSPLRRRRTIARSRATGRTEPSG